MLWVGVVQSYKGESRYTVGVPRSEYLWGKLELGGKTELKVELPWINLLHKLGSIYSSVSSTHMNYHSVLVMAFPDKVLPYRFHFPWICVIFPLRLSFHLLWSLLGHDASWGAAFLLSCDSKLLHSFLPLKPLAASFQQLLAPPYFWHLPPCSAIAYKGELSLGCLPIWSTEMFKLTSAACRGGMSLCICTVLSATPSSSTSLGITGSSLRFLPTESRPARPVAG